MTNWNYQRTTSPPQYITVRFASESNPNGSRTFSSSDTTDTTLTYRSLSYTDTEGVEQFVELVTSKIERTSKSFAKVNPSAVSSRLSQGLAATASTVQSEIRTIYDIGVSASGPFLKSETITSKISIAELAGKLAVPSYAAYQPSGTLITSGVLRTDYSTTWTPNGVATQSVTSGRVALGLTQAGQQAFAEQVRQREDLDFNASKGSDFIADVVSSMAELVSQGAEVRAESGAPPVPMKPRDSDIARDSVSESNSGRRTTKGRLAGDGDLNAVPTTTRIYDMPFAPDDFYSWEEP
jgi:hypothetical protein